MQKLFRFKYEECNGTCFAHEDIFFAQLGAIHEVRRKVLVDLVVKAHDNLCDNPDYSFGLDYCDITDTFIGHFIQPGRIDVFSSYHLNTCITDMCETVVDADIPQIEGVCTFGDTGEGNLAEIILSNVA